MIAFYDRRADKAFFRLRDAKAITDEEQDWGGVFGYGEDGEVVSVEVWFAKNLLPEWLIAVLPAPEEADP